MDRRFAFVLSKAVIWCLPYRLPPFRKAKGCATRQRTRKGQGTRPTGEPGKAAPDSALALLRGRGTPLNEQSEESMGA
jgi:hypothetical protein